ncbi:hypothetical protein ACH5RR_011348 [Cinchona calisaya]|uniref:Pentatricopeptide repeat-containing protein n=1 Tax=Cinchona calisaya TaxID=153742 RepID=A0ABD3A4N6_9GENT
MVRNGVSLGTHLSALIIYCLGCTRELVSAVKLFSLLPDEQKNTATYTALIATYFSCGDLHKRMETFDTMRRQGISVAIRTYSVPFSCLEQNCQVQKLNG